MEDFSLKYVNLELWANQESHETQGLSSKHLVVRRGQPFKLTLLFKGRPFSPYTDSLIFRAVLGDLYVEFPATFSKPQHHSRWSAEVQPGESYSQSVTVHIFAPAHSPVGCYDLHLHLLSQPWQRSYKIGEFVLLCNPWCPADSVYIQNESQREEYVKNDFGFLYMGTPKNMAARPWEFGQYEEGILEICLNLLQVSPQHSKNRRMDYLSRSDPVYLSRVVCAMINCEDDRGVLKGNWSQDFRNGIPPSQWSGSADILKLWAGSNYSPVKYGQCWVFAAIMCTVMRVLGIPSRVVTNFNSAHDTNGNLVIEEFYDEKGKKLHMSRDSIWNFHVWVECWMSRPDIGSAFDGWQVLDPTPQERSRGVFCCGPSPVRGIRDRRLDVIYDIPFVYAEVNADVCTVIVKDGQAVSRTVDTERVGSLICTKSPGSNMPQDVTNAYKQPKAVMSPYGTMNGTPRSRRSFAGRETKQGLAVSLRLNNVPVAGENISFSVTVSNKDNVPKTLKEHVNAQAKEYNSSPLETFWEDHNILQIAPYEVKIIQHQIPHSVYERMLMGDNLVNLAVVMKDEATQERVLASEEFNITEPEISIQIANEDDIVVNKEHSALVVFRNPLPMPVSGVLTVMGSGLLDGKVQSKLHLLQPGETMEKTVAFTPKMAGTKMLQANLVLRNSPVIIRGFRTVTVMAA
ncbi:transglutaminase 5, like [Megalops cyprinoides]|uniref:transglutaminase 5, like n=1 Tax=Megalops cyprinoides TaxID=118141 RepID=UPI0018650F1C|nr:transglutaminase 5, like [Megalops cyprinoides]